ncbi:MAG: hypothetical protein HY770_08065 [Chitinivibrionia bacterium]|nr:hypothetical protein [Chitinivibrionia bacterium]
MIFPALHAGRDGILGMALILQFLAERDTTLDGLLESYPPFVIKKEKAALAGPFDAGKIYEVIRKQEPVTVDTRDGVRAQFGDGWYHVRVSNTEGIVRVIAEAATDERASELVRAARAALAASWR